MILKSWCELRFYRGVFSIGFSKKALPINENICDECGEIYIERSDKTKKRYEKYNRDLCPKCSRRRASMLIGEVGKNILTSFSIDDKKKYSSIAGKISHEKNPNNKGKFSKERWNKLSDEEKNKQVTRANQALHEKIRNDENFKREYYLKIFQNSKIGFTSKGHNELHMFLSDYGFIQHVIIGEMEVDECNEDLKIIIEYNGDMYHCNPRKWKPDQYNTAIKMTANEKWEKDRKRYYKLKNLGYKVFVVWEEDWYLKREEISNRIIKYINGIKNEIN